MIGLIVARSKNNVIGRNGEIPWKIKGEQKFFKELTIGNIVVMGRKSYEEIGHPLPNRQNIIVSKTMKYEGENLITVSSLAEALALSDKPKRHLFLMLCQLTCNLQLLLYCSTAHCVLPLRNGLCKRC